MWCKMTYRVLTSLTNCTPPQVMAVENEMRELLTEVEGEKKGMEQKFQKLSKAFKELQDQLT